MPTTRLLMVTSLDGSGLEEQLTDVISRVSPWFEYNRLSMNCKKTQFMVFSTRQKCAKINLKHIMHGTKNIERTTSVKYLGIKLDENLTFSEHIEYIKRKTIGKIKFLSRLNNVLSQNTMLMLYKSLILPTIDYGDMIYDCVNLSDRKSLQCLQNMAFKSILKVPKLTSTEAIHRS